MGRNKRQGISFYRMDSGHIINKKVRLLCNEFESDGYFIWSCLLDYAYANYGYYFDMGDKDELELFASEYCKMKLNLIKEVIAGCIRRDLFDKRVADLFGLLTSEMMQETFVHATADRRSKGSTFEMMQELILYPRAEHTPNILIVPRNNLILPPKKPIILLNNPHIREDNIIEEKNRGEAGQAGQPAAGDLKPKRKFFIPPELAEAEQYFLQVIGNPKITRHWPEDRCKNQAQKFYDHYTANGWVQNGGKKIVDWKAAARNFIRNEIDGKFSGAGARVPASAPAPPQPPAAGAQSRQPAAAPNPYEKLAAEINFLYDRFLDGNCTITSIEVAHYNHLYRASLMKLTDSDRQFIRNIGHAHLTEKGLLTGDNNHDNALLEPTLKKFAVLHIFRQLQQADKTEVFKNPNQP